MVAIAYTGSTKAGTALMVVCPACGAQATIVPRFGDVIATYHLCRPTEDGTQGRHPVRMEPLEIASGAGSRGS